MALNNPALSRNPAFRAGTTVAPAATALATAEGLQDLYTAPSATSADTDRMTVEDTVVKTALLFAVLLATAVVGWFFPVLTIPGLVVGLVLGFVNAFKKSPSAPLILAYAAAEGLFVGGISSLFEYLYSGVVMQAVLATLAVFAVMLVLFASGKVRASKKMTKVFLVAIIGYGVFSVANMFFIWFGNSDLAFGWRSATIMGIPLGIIIGIIAVLLAAYSLVLDFEFIKNGVANRAPRKMGWYGAFGLMVTLIWLYIEFLRMFALARE